MTLDPRRSIILVDIFMFFLIFYIRSYWFVTFRPSILYWSWISCKFQLPCSTKPLLTTGVFAHRKSRKNDEFFEFSWELSQKPPGSGNRYFRTSMWRKFLNAFEMRRSALRVPGGNQVDGLPPARHTEPRWIGVTLVLRRFVIMVDIFMFLLISYINSYWFVTFRPSILYWS